MTRFTLIGILLLVGSSLYADQRPTATTGSTAEPTAHATLVDTEGRTVGQAQFHQTPHGVLLRLELENVTPGVHGLHIHEAGRCDRPTFESAGGHFNPTKRQHGFLNPQGPHVGDLPNIDVPPTAKLTVEHMIPDVTLAGGQRPLLDGDGAALMIHTGKDDYRSDPAGDAGDRLACGPIQKSES